MAPLEHESLLQHSEPEETEAEAHYRAHRSELLEQLQSGKGGRVALEPRGSGGVGLLNQGATCYMNSLLQALFHTPEFRDAIYCWRYDPAIHGDPARSIPLQLQRLFAQLQLGSSAAVSTKPLTSAFGFTEMESREQHDVQELCRVLFDALGRSAPALSTEIERLYAGQTIHYVRSREPDEAGRLPESRREEKFLDLQVPIQDCHTLEEALRRLVEPESLDGDNQWQCDELGRKVDALKGIDLGSLPGLLCLQLLRFVFDLSTMRRRKLTEMLSIPLELDLGFMAPAGAANPYELSAVCCHKGTAHGGHYHALIRDVHRRVWYDANDAHVAVLSPEQEQSLFPAREQSASSTSGAAAIPPGAAMTSCDAYFLVYRRCDLQAPDVHDGNVPEPHQSELRQESVRLEALQRAYLVHKQLMEVRVYAPTAAATVLVRYASQELLGLVREEHEEAARTREPQSVLLSAPGSKTVAALRCEAVGAFVSEAEQGSDPWPFSMSLGLDESKGPRTRLREFDACTGEVKAPLDEGMTVKDALGGAGATSRSLLLEVRSMGEDFEEWVADSYWFVACRWDPVEGSISLERRDVVGLRLPMRPDAGPPVECSQPDAAPGNGEGATAEDGAAPPRQRRTQDRTPAVGVVRAAAAAQFGYKGTSPALVLMSGPRAGEVLLDDQCSLLEALGGGSGGQRIGSQVLCVEAHGTSGDARLQCVAHYELVKNTAHISFNHPDRPDELAEFRVSISKTASLAEFKAQAAALLGVDAASLHLSRGQKAPQFKNEAQTLRASGVSESGHCFIGHGAPCGADGFVLSICLYLPTGPHRVKELFSHNARASCSVRGLRHALLEPMARWGEAQELSPFVPAELQWRRLRLRDGQAGKQFAILRDDRTLRSALLGLADGRQIAVQVLDHDEELTPDDLVVHVRAWKYAEGKLSAPMEFVVRKSHTLGWLREALVAKFGSLLEGATKKEENGGQSADAQPDWLEIAALPTVGPPLTVKRCATLKWSQSQLNSSDSDALQQPISEDKELRDGVTLVVRSARVAAKGPPAEPVKKGSTTEPSAGLAQAKAKARAAGAGRPPGGVVAGARPARERALVIEVAHPEACFAPEHVGVSSTDAEGEGASKD